MPGQKSKKKRATCYNELHRAQMYDRCFSTNAKTRSVRVYHWCASSINDTPQYNHTAHECVAGVCGTNAKNTQCTSVSLVRELNQRHTAIQSHSTRVCRWCMRYDNRSAHECVTQRQYTCGPNKKRTARRALRWCGYDLVGRTARILQMSSKAKPKFDGLHTSVRRRKRSARE